MREENLRLRNEERLVTAELEAAQIETARLRAEAERREREVERLRASVAAKREARRKRDGQ